mmetsp:Transcript_8095/g.15978  ORF Transcript_8095/g.15978 Transcript_8095/m.15978 type:complete len:207 (+) Transcript_8095:478-1098(+)
MLITHQYHKLMFMHVQKRAQENRFLCIRTDGSGPYTRSPRLLLCRGATGLLLCQTALRTSDPHFRLCVLGNVLGQDAAQRFGLLVGEVSAARDLWEQVGVGGSDRVADAADKLVELRRVGGRGGVVEQAFRGGEEEGHLLADGERRRVALCEHSGVRGGARRLGSLAMDRIGRRRQFEPQRARHRAHRLCRRRGAQLVRADTDARE